MIISVTESSIFLTRPVSVALVTKSYMSRSLSFPSTFAWLKNLLRMNFLKTSKFNYYNWNISFSETWQEEEMKTYFNASSFLRMDPDKSLNESCLLILNLKEIVTKYLSNFCPFELLSFSDPPEFISRPFDGRKRVNRWLGSGSAGWWSPARRPGCASQARCL